MNQDVPMKKCSICGEEFPATTEYFHKKLNGLCGSCINCRNKRQNDLRYIRTETQRKARELKRKQELDSGVRTCSKCHNTYPLTEEYFGRQKQGKFGFFSKCKCCVAEYDHIHKKEYQRKNRDKIKERKKTYRMKNREKIKETLHMWYEKNKKSVLKKIHDKYVKFDREISIRERRELKKQAYECLGGKCVVCGESRIPFLNIDHVFNDGMNETKKSNQFYKQVIKEKDSGLYQILCMNHNWKKYCEFLKAKYVNTKVAIRARSHNAMIKEEVIDHYGGKCECCGIEDIDFLTIDHISNNGADHKRQIKLENGKPIGSVIRWLYKNGCPDNLNLRVLCFNCNTGRYHNGGICPHKDSKYFNWDGT
jgi:hypothetical protein